MDILLIARIFPRPCGAQKNATQLAKYWHILYAKPSNKVYVLHLGIDAYSLIFDVLSMSCRHTNCKLYDVQSTSHRRWNPKWEKASMMVSMCCCRGLTVRDLLATRGSFPKELIIDLFCFSTESHSQKHREACRVVCDKTFTGLVSFAWPSFFGV